MADYPISKKLEEGKIDLETSQELYDLKKDSMRYFEKIYEQNYICRERDREREMERNMARQQKETSKLSYKLNQVAMGIVLTALALTPFVLTFNAYSTYSKDLKLEKKANAVSEKIADLDGKEGLSGTDWEIAYREVFGKNKKFTRIVPNRGHYSLEWCKDKEVSIRDLEEIGEYYGEGR